MEGKILKGLPYPFIFGALIILLITSPSFSQAPAPDAFSILRIEVTETASGSRVAIEGSKPFAYRVFRLSDPLRVVVEVPRARLGKIAGAVEVKDGIINVIQKRQIGDPQKQGARIEIGLDRLVKYDVVPEGNFLYLNFAKPPIPPPKEVQEKEKKEATPAAPLRKARSLKEIEISVKVDGVKVDIKGDGLIPEYKSFELASPTRLVVDLPDLSNASGKKEIDVGSRLLKHIRIGQHPDKLRLVFDVSEAKLPPYQLTRKGQELKLTLGEVKKEAPQEEKAPVVEGPKPVPMTRKGQELKLTLGEVKKEAPQEEKAPVVEGPKPVPNEAVIISGIDYWFEKGNEFANASRWQEAKEAYARAIKLNPKYAPAFYARGVASFWLGDYRQAIQDYDKALELNYPKDDLAYYSRGVANSKLGDHRQAIRDYDKAIQLEPKYAPAFYARGAAYGKLGDSSREARDYKTAAKMGYKPAEDFLKSKGISW
jgi:tetratricopeptide (TPR) repeat protein